MWYVGNAVSYKNYSFYYHFHIFVSHAHVQLYITPRSLIIIHNNLSQNNVLTTELISLYIKEKPTNWYYHSL